MATTYSDCEALIRAVHDACGVDDGSERYRTCVRAKHVDTTSSVTCATATPSRCQNDGYSTSLYGCTASGATYERPHVLPVRGSPSWTVAAAAITTTTT